MKTKNKPKTKKENVINPLDKPNKKTIATIKGVRNITKSCDACSYYNDGGVCGQWQDCFKKSKWQKKKENLEDKVEEFYTDFFIGGKKFYEDVNKPIKIKKSDKLSNSKSLTLDKKTFIIIMNLIIEQDKLNEKLSDGIGLINSSYTILEPDKIIREAVWKMLEIFFSSEEINTIQWQMYEDITPKVIYEKNKKTGVFDIEHSVETLSELYDYIMENKE